MCVRFLTPFLSLQRVGATPRTQTAKFVQFYDVRGVPKALEQQNIPFEGGTLSIEEAVMRLLSSSLCV